MKLVKSFLTSLQSKKRSDYEKEKLIHDYIVSNVAYGYPGGKKEPEGDAYSAIWCSGFKESGM